MPRFQLRLNVDQRGTIFNVAKSKAAAQAMVVAANEALAQEGLRFAVDRFHNVLRHPSGYYVSKLNIERKRIQRTLNDSGVPYGGWLNGLDPRNRTSRFKGYFVFRDTAKYLQNNKAAIVQPVVTEFVRTIQ